MELLLSICLPDEATPAEIDFLRREIRAQVEDNDSGLVRQADWVEPCTK